MRIDVILPPHRLPSPCVITLLLPALAVAGCSDLLPCENAEVRRVASPDGEVEVVAFERDCGATTDLSYHVSVLPTGDLLPDDPGNTFVTGRSANLGTLVQTPLVGWRGDSVHIFFVVPREVYEQQQEAAGRPVRYETGDGIDIVH